MAEAGIDGLTMEAVAERVGVSLRTVYRYFPDRASPLTAALARDDQAVPFERADGEEAEPTFWMASTGEPPEP